MEDNVHLIEIHVPKTGDIVWVKYDNLNDTSISKKFYMSKTDARSFKHLIDTVKNAIIN